MVLDAEAVIDRRRLKRRVTAWRIAAVMLALLFLGALALSNDKMSGPGALLPHVARLSVSGIITDDRKMKDVIDKLGKSDQVKAVILDINSPGGTTTGGEAMYDAIRRLAEKKPVVAVCGTLATSAAYIVALASDRIFVYGNTITGSVGVIFPMGRGDRFDEDARRQSGGVAERRSQGCTQSFHPDRRESARADQ